MMAGGSGGARPRVALLAYRQPVTGANACVLGWRISIPWVLPSLGGDQGLVSYPF